MFYGTSTDIVLCNGTHNATRSTSIVDSDTESEMTDHTTTDIENCLKKMVRSIELAYSECDIS